MSGVGIVIAVVVIVVVAAIVVAVVMRRRSKAATVTPPAKPPLEPPAPMLGLETALDQATDRSGRNMREKIESGSIDDLLVVDDTGPVLRRALDQVEHTQVDHGSGESSAAAPLDDAVEAPSTPAPLDDAVDPVVDEPSA